MTNTYTRHFWTLLVLAWFGTWVACTRSVEKSMTNAREHVSMLVEVTNQDVDELRKGMPEGAKQLSALYQAKLAPKDDLESVRAQLDRARNHVQDLRVAKSTFFILADRDGTVLRGDREPDQMAGKNLFTAFPETRQSLEGKAVLARGEMPEAAGIKGRRDGQLIFSVPVAVNDTILGVYASGWSWSAYAYRLQNALTSAIRSKKKEQEKEPLVYVYIIVEDAVFGAPTAPEVNARAIQQNAPLSKVVGESILNTPLEVTGRDFGLAVKRAPSLGANVAVAVLRSET